MTTLSGKVAAITGAASGIGLACARRLVEAGAESCSSTGPATGSRRSAPRSGRRRIRWSST